jgi:hypothetical protein
MLTLLFTPARVPVWPVPADPVPVWPYKNGTVRGVSLAPLCPTVPEAALRDERLYAVLALFDAIRSGPESVTLLKPK